MKKQNPLDKLLDQMLAQMSDEDKETFKNEPEDAPGARFHFFQGMAMRNQLGLWRNDTPLTKWFKKHGIFHGDDRSSDIFRALWCRLNNKPFSIERQAEKHAQFWQETYNQYPDGTTISGAGPKPLCAYSETYDSNLVNSSKPIPHSKKKSFGWNPPNK